MIEKILKSVKSSNKKRGRNITIGAVVGMLLSCTVVMGADVAGLEITKDSDTIIFKDENGKNFDPEKSEGNPYPENTWAGKTYTNNSVILGKNLSGAATGVKISDLTKEMKFAFINNGIISAEGTTGYPNGISNEGSIETLENNGIISAEGTGNYINGISNEGSIKTLKNNGIISAEGNHPNGILNGGSIETLENNGIISVIGTGTLISGIYTNSTIERLTNNGLISSIGIKMTDVYAPTGISTDEESIITELVNNGSISVIGSAKEGDYFSVYGISNDTGTIENLTNNGLISGIGLENNCGYGVWNGANGSNGGKIINLLANNGLIYGKGETSGYGIHNSTTIENIINTGTVYGSTNAIYTDIYDDDSVYVISNAYNYGLLVSGDSTKNVVAGITIVDSSTGTLNDNEIKNYGLAFVVDSSSDTDKYIGDDSYHNSFGKIHHDISIDGVNYDIINVGAELDNSKEIKNWKSLGMKDGELHSDVDNIAGSEISDFSSDKKYILNGIKDTLKVFGKNNKLNNSVVNAYETAVVMEKESMLTLENTVVNGNVSKIEGISAVNILGDGSTLIVKGDSAINAKDKATAIKVAGKNNTVVLSGNAIVNGKLESTGKNTLTLNGKTEGSMNMLHDISGFTNMNIDSNVTFFEDTKVTGTNTVTVADTGVLTLRLKKEDTVTTYGDSSNIIPTATHAFSNRDKKHEMTIKGDSLEGTGTLNFITNGIGREILVDMENIKLENMKINATSIIDTAEIEGDFIHLGAGLDLGGIVNPKVNKYNSLNKIYKSIYNSTGKNLDALRDILSMTYLGKNYDYNNGTDEEQLENLLTYLNNIYTGSPYSYSSELSRRSVGMFRDIVTENEFRPNQDNWLIMGGLTHADGGTKDTYYGRNYHGFDTGTSDTRADMKLTGAYILAKYGYSENTSLGLTLGGNKSEAKLDMSKVKGNSGYLGAFAENYRGNLTLKAGAGIQYSEYDADRRTMGGHSYSDKYSDMTYDIYLNGRYSHNIGKDLFLEPYATLSYTYGDQDGANEGSKALAIETDSKSFDYTVGKVGVDLKKVIPHEKGKSTFSAGVNYTKILDGAEEEYITGRFKGGSAFDILVAHKNEHSIGLNAKYALELENGVIFDVKGTYSVERDSHNQSGKNKTKGEWIVGAGIGYKF